MRLLFPSNKGLQLLAEGIIKQACMDYVDSLLGKKVEQYKTPPEVIHEVEWFFRSFWFGVLTTVDPIYLMEMLRKNAKAVADELHGQFNNSNKRGHNNDSKTKRT